MNIADVVRKKKNKGIKGIYSERPAEVDVLNAKPRTKQIFASTKKKPIYFILHLCVYFLLLVLSFFKSMTLIDTSI